MLTAIFGGTFNPFHKGHYEIVESLNNDPDIKKILLMPDRLPPHKTSKYLIDDDTRIKMCQIAADKFSKCELCLIEFERQGKSYTIDTVRLLQEKYPKTEFAFVIGGDMLVYFENWHRYEELLKMLSFIVFKRTATNQVEFNVCINRLRNKGMKIIIKNDLITDVSSTELRENFSQNVSLIPTEIYDFLTERGAYGE